MGSRGWAPRWRDHVICLLALLALTVRAVPGTAQWKARDLARGLAEKATQKTAARAPAHSMHCSYITRPMQSCTRTPSPGVEGVSGGHTGPGERARQARGHFNECGFCMSCDTTQPASPPPPVPLSDVKRVAALPTCDVCTGCTALLRFVLVSTYIFCLAFHLCSASHAHTHPSRTSPVRGRRRAISVRLTGSMRV